MNLENECKKYLSEIDNYWAMVRGKNIRDLSFEKVKDIVCEKSLEFHKKYGTDPNIILISQENLEFLRCITNTPDLLDERSSNYGLYGLTIHSVGKEGIFNPALT